MRTFEHLVDRVHSIHSRCETDFIKINILFTPWLSNIRIFIFLYRTDIIYFIWKSIRLIILNWIFQSQIFKLSYSTPKRRPGLKNRSSFNVTEPIYFGISSTTKFLFKTWEIFSCTVYVWQALPLHPLRMEAPVIQIKPLSRLWGFLIASDTKLNIVSVQWKKGRIVCLR